MANSKSNPFRFRRDDHIANAWACVALLFTALIGLVVKPDGMIGWLTVVVISLGWLIWSAMPHEVNAKNDAKKDDEKVSA